MTNRMTRPTDQQGAKGQELSASGVKFGNDSYCFYPFTVCVGAAGAPLSGGRYER